MSTAIMSTYGRQPVRFVRGEGVWLWDESGARYLDGLAGIAVCGLGHAHPDVARAVSEQAATLVHTSNLYEIPSQEELASRLTELAGMDSVFFANSGAEANEAAIKVARAYGHSRGIDIPYTVVTDQSFHGRTMATLSATGNSKVHKGFEPLVTGFVRVPFGHVDAIAKVADERQDIAAVMVEPVLGEGGVVVPGDDYLPRLRALCDDQGWLLMIDEVQTGVGRTGRWFAHQHTGIKPDVMTLAKALGNGVPIGACLAAGPATGVLGPGTHGSTFGGNPLACRAALAVIETMEREGLVELAEQRGEKLRAGLARALEGANCVVEIRGRGLMVGVEIDKPCADIVQRCFEDKLLLNVTADNVVRLLPPLVISDDEIEQVVSIVSDAIQAWNSGS